MLSKEEIAETYGRRARRYDLTANLYYLLGFRESAYRRQAVRALRLARGDTVVELCCGTGLNFAALGRAVGPGGIERRVEEGAEVLLQSDRHAGASLASGVS